MNKKQWSFIPENHNDAYLGVFEFLDRHDRFHDFAIVHSITHNCLVFGSVCNAGLLQSGYIKCEEGESTEQTLCELHADLEVYYNDGANYVARIVCNECM